MNESKSEYHKKELNNRQERWQSKPLHGQYLKDIKDKTDNDITWSWMKNGELKKETEGFLTAAQDQALRTNAIQAKVDKVANDSKCRLCKEKDETIDHLISSCSKIAQTDYKERRNKVASMLHWNLCKKYHLYLHPKNGGNIMSRKCCKMKKSKFSGTLKFKQTNIWLITHQI